MSSCVNIGYQFAVFKLYTDFEVQLVFRNIFNNKFTDEPNNQV